MRMPMQFVLSGIMVALLLTACNAPAAPPNRPGAGGGAPRSIVGTPSSQ